MASPSPAPDPGPAVRQYTVRTTGGDVTLDLSPLLEWRQDSELTAFLTDLHTAARGGAAAKAFQRLLEDTEALLRALPSDPPAKMPEVYDCRTANANAPAGGAAPLPANATPDAFRLGDSAVEAAQPRLDSRGSIKRSGSDPWVGVLASAAALLELSWEKLHLGYWKDVHVAWRNGYSLTCLVDCYLRMLLLRPLPISGPATGPPQPAQCSAVGDIPGEDRRLAAAAATRGLSGAAPAIRDPRAGEVGLPLLQWCLRQLDLGLMMGGPLWREQLHRLVGELHAAAVRAVEATTATAVAAAKEDQVADEMAAAAAAAAAADAAVDRDSGGGSGGGSGDSSGGSSSSSSSSSSGTDSPSGGADCRDGLRPWKRRRCGAQTPAGGAGDAGMRRGGSVTSQEDDDDENGNAEGSTAAAAAAAATAAAAAVSVVRLPRGSLDGAPGRRVPAVEAPSLEEFLLSYMVPEQPVVITGAMEHWPAMRLWSDMSYLERAAGCRTVPVEVGEHYLADGWGQQLMTLRDFLRRHIIPWAQQEQQQQHRPQQRQREQLQQQKQQKQQQQPPALQSLHQDSQPAPQSAQQPPPPQSHGSPPPESHGSPPLPPRGYLAQHPLFEQIPALRRDIVPPDYCCLGETGEVRAVNAWLGPGGTTTPLHTDPDHNLLAQVVGRKYVRLYSPSLTERLHPFPSGSVNSNSSQVDLDRDLESDLDAEIESEGLAMLDHGSDGAAPGARKLRASEGQHPGGVRFPGVASLPFQDVVLEPGQMLYIPPGWWHFVRALSMSFSVSFWWQ